MQRNKAVDVACSLWHSFNIGNWQDARELLNDDFVIDWPQSKEKIIGPDNYIAFNRAYLKVPQIQILNHQYSYDNWEHMDKVVLQTHVKTQMGNGKILDTFAISFFEIQDSKIISIVEYWADSYTTQEWEKKIGVLS